MRLKIAQDGYVTLNQFPAEEGGRIIVNCDDSVREIVKPIVAKCRGLAQSKYRNWRVESGRSLMLFEAFYELHIQVVAPQQAGR